MGAPVMRIARELQRKVTPRGEAKIKWDEPLDEDIRPEKDLNLWSGGVIKDLQDVHRMLSDVYSVRIEFVLGLHLQVCTYLG